MFTKISKKMTDRLIQKKIIERNDYEIYQYGLEQIFTNILVILTLVILGISINELWQELIYAVAFMALRSYAGGFHASTPVKCYFLTSILSITVLSVMKYVEMSNFICLGLLVVSSVVIFSLSPVEAQNKPLDDIEKIIYRKKAIIVWGIESVIALVSAILKMNDILLCIAMAQFTLGLSQVIGVTIYTNKVTV